MLNLRLLALIVVSVALSALAQVSLRKGMSGEHIQRLLASDRAAAALATATDEWVIGGLALYALGAVLWLLVLARAEVTYAYPFVGLGFLFTALLGAILLREPLSAARIAGTLLVVIGVALVARS